MSDILDKALVKSAYDKVRPAIELTLREQMPDRFGVAVVVTAVDQINPAGAISDPHAISSRRSAISAVHPSPISRSRSRKRNCRHARASPPQTFLPTISGWETPCSGEARSSTALWQPAPALSRGMMKCFLTGSLRRFRPRRVKLSRSSSRTMAGELPALRNTHGARSAPHAGNGTSSPSAAR